MFCCYGIKQKPQGELKEDFFFFSPVHKAKHTLLPKMKNQVHDLLDSCGFLLLRDYFISHMLQYIKVYLTHSFLKIVYVFYIMHHCQRINKINIVGYSYVLKNYI